MYLVAKDMEDTLSRWVGNQANAEMVTDIRVSITNALQFLWGEYEWAYYQGQYQIQIDAPYTTGTVTFDSTTRRFTLTGGTWPDWANYGSIRISTKDARVLRRISDTVIEIEATSPFVDDIASATTYTMYRAEYPIPMNIRKMGYLFFAETPYLTLDYVPPLEFVSKVTHLFGNVPRIFTVQKDRTLLDGLTVNFWPYPTRAYTCRFNFIRMPTEVTIWSESTGKVTVAEGSTAVSGIGTAFDDLHEGCILRIGRDGTNVPTPRYGLYPFREEALIDTVASSTSLALRHPASYATTAMKYLISSMIDIEYQIMHSTFIQQCYVELAKVRKLPDKDLATLIQVRDRELEDAKARSAPVQEITYAGTFNSGKRYWTWYKVGI